MNVTMPNRTTNIGDSRNATITRDVTSSFTLKSNYGGATKSNSANCNVNVSQEANVIKNIIAATNTLSYTNISAGSTSATPVSSHTPKYVFTSESESSTAPSSTYGSMSVNVTYALSESKNGFTNVNTSGVLTATNRGTTIGNARISGTITKSVVYS